MPEAVIFGTVNWFAQIVFATFGTTNDFFKTTKSHALTAQLLMPNMAVNVSEHCSCMSIKK